MLSFIMREVQGARGCLARFGQRSVRENAVYLADQPLLLSMLMFLNLGCWSSLLLGSVLSGFEIQRVPEPQVDQLFEEVSMVTNFLFLTLIGPWDETIIYHFAPIVLGVAAIRQFAPRKAIFLEGLLVGATIGWFAVLHGFNAEMFSWLAALTRVPMGILLSIFCYIQLRFYSGTMELRLLRAFAAPFLLHATYNALVWMVVVTR